MSLSDSDLSSLSSAPPSDEEPNPMALDEPVGITKYFQKKQSETPPPKRALSPPHEYVLADNPDIAFIVMFRARFHEVFPRSTPHLGPQDIERGVVESPPGDHIERRNHYTRPLEEAIQTHASQWPKAWQGKNPLHGGRNFASMSPEERLQLLKSLILWSLSSSEAVQAKIKESYKQARHEDDLNQPLSVQPWGRDSLKRRYWLIEGHDDTHFRLYREGNPTLKNVTWWSVAGTIPELQGIADKLEEEKGIHSKKLSERIRNSIPRFEGSEEKRKRRDYRIARKAAFSRPEPGFSLYEGRTRGKKLKYTYSDDEDIFSDGLPPPRRSGRNNSGLSTPAEPTGPRFSASGRQIRSRAGGLYGESLLAGQREDTATADEDGTERRQRTRNTRMNGYTDYGIDDEDAESNGGQSSGNEWQGGEEEDENEFEGDDEEEVSGDESVVNGEPASLVVQLKYNKQGDSKGPEEQSADIIPETQKAAVAERPIDAAEQQPVVEPSQILPVGNGPPVPVPEVPIGPSTNAAPVEEPSNAIASALSEGTVQEGGDSADTTVPTPVQQPEGAI